MKAKWQDAGFRTKIEASTNAPEYHERRGRAISKSLQLPESKARRSQINKDAWTPEKRQKQARVQRERQRKYWASQYGVDRWEDIPRDYDCSFTEELKEQIRNRHGLVCALCGEAQGSDGLDVHHIDYDKKNADPYNLIALCHACHTRTNFNRHLWSGLFSTYMRSVPVNQMPWVRAVI